MTEKPGIVFLDIESDLFRWVPQGSAEACAPSIWVTNMNVMQIMGHHWVHPRRPSKIEGRRGTKRGWKATNPSRFAPIYEKKVLTMSQKSLNKILNIIG